MTPFPLPMRYAKPYEEAMQALELILHEEVAHRTSVESAILQWRCGNFAYNSLVAYYAGYQAKRQEVQQRLAAAQLAESAIRLFVRKSSHCPGCPGCTQPNDDAAALFLTATNALAVDLPLPQETPFEVTERMRFAKWLYVHKPHLMTDWPDDPAAYVNPAACEAFA